MPELAAVMQTNINVQEPTVEAIVRPGIHHAVEASGIPAAQAVEVLCLVAVVLAIATLSYRLIERPGRNLLRRVFEVRGAVAGDGPLV